MQPQMQVRPARPVQSTRSRGFGSQPEPVATTQDRIPLSSYVESIAAADSATLERYLAEIDAGRHSLKAEDVPRARALLSSELSRRQRNRLLLYAGGALVVGIGAYLVFRKR